MYVKKIKYTDYNGNEQEEEFRFNISRTEFFRLEAGSESSDEKGFEAMVKEMTRLDDRAKILETFEKIVQMAYGIKSPDGKRFMKSPEIRQAFIESPAYDDLIMELATDEKSMSEFVNAIAPKELTQQASAAPIPVNNK